MLCPNNLQRGQIALFQYVRPGHDHKYRVGLVESITDRVLTINTPMGFRSYAWKYIQDLTTN